MSMNFYQLLKLEHTASEEDIRQAIDFARITGSVDQDQLTRAETVLLNKAKRKIYDIHILKVMPPEPEKNIVVSQTQTQQPSKPAAEYCTCNMPMKNELTGFCMHCGKKLRPPRKPSFYHYLN